MDITKFLKTGEAHIALITVRVRTAGHNLDQRQITSLLVEACMNGRAKETHHGYFALPKESVGAPT
jgi:hypothetical protein